MPNKETENGEMTKDGVEKPEEQAEKAEKIKEFQRLAEPMFDQFYSEGKTPFGIPRTEAIEKFSARAFVQVEKAELNLDNDFLERMTEFIRAINDATGQHYTLGKTTLQVVEYHLQIAAGKEPDIDIEGIRYLDGQMNQGLLKATGVDLDQWAQEYLKVHGEEVRDIKTNERFIDILSRDFYAHEYNQGKLVKMLKEYAKENGADSLNPQVALELLKENGSIVPEEWRDELAEHQDGKELLEAIENAKKGIQVEQITDTLESNYSDLSAEDRAANPITTDDVIAVASFEEEISVTWVLCDDQTKKMIKNIMSELANRLGGKLGTSKGEPIVKFKK